MAPMATETTPLLNEDQAANLERAVSYSNHSYHGSLDGEESGYKGNPEDFETTYRIESKLLLQYSTPLIATYLLQYSYTLVTVFVAGRLGTNELGAASLASLTASITGLSVYEGLATSLDTLTSQAYGAGRKKMVGLHVQRMSAMMVVVTIPIGALWLCSPWILATIVPEPELAQLAGIFLRIYLLGAPGFGVFEALKRFTQAQGVFTASMVAALVCAPLNILWNWLFAFKLGFGFAGAAYAVALSNTLQPIVLVLYIKFGVPHTLECWPGFSAKRCFRNWGPMFKLGVPGIAMTVSEWLAFDILTFAASYVSTQALAAQSVLTTVAMFTYHIPMPVAVAAATRFGNLIGRGALKAARKGIRFYYLVFLCLGLFNLILLTTLRKVVALVFTEDKAVRDLVVATMPLMAASQLIDAGAALSNGLLRGIGRQRIGGWVNLGVYYIWAIPVSLFLTFGPAHLGLLGLWIGPISGLAFVFILVTTYIKRSNWSVAVQEARSRNE